MIPLLLLLIATTPDLGMLVKVDVAQQEDVAYLLQKGVNVYEYLGSYTICEMTKNQLRELKSEGFSCEIIETALPHFNYYLVFNPRYLDFSQIQKYAKVLQIYDNVALVRGFNTKIEKIPELGFEIQRIHRISIKPREPVTFPLPGKIKGVSEIVAEVSTDSLTSYIQTLQDFGTRFSYTFECSLAGEWLYDKFEEFGLPVEFHEYGIYSADMVGCVLIDSSQGWAVGENGLWQTSDGGDTWAAETTFTDMPYGIDCIGDKRWIVGNGGLTAYLLGSTWVENYVSADYLWGVDFIDTLHGFASGSDDNGGVIFGTRDGGVSWDSLIHTTSGLYDITFINESEGWVCGENPGVILHSENAGTTWTTQFSDPGVFLVDVFFVDSSHGCAVGGDASNMSARIFHTSDGGETWEPQTAPASYLLIGTDWLSSGEGYCVGLMGEIIYTNNSGTTWTAQTSNTTAHLYAVDFVDDEHGLTVGTIQTALHTSDGGTNWNESSVGEPIIWRNVVATQSGTAKPDKLIVIGGHYDSISDDPYNDAPGADDNASGTAAVLEVARILANYATEYTIKYICFSGEEQGLWGSWAYAEDAYVQGLDIICMLNFDMIAYCDDANYDLNVITDYASEELADLYIDAADNYTDLITYKQVNPSSGGSDHFPFWQFGYPAIFAIERAGSFWNPYYHSTGDLLATLTMPFETEVVKAGVASLLFLSGVLPDLMVTEVTTIDSSGVTSAPEPGDTVSLIIELQNTGHDATAISGSLLTQDTTITILQANATWPDIPGDSISDNSASPFLFVVHDSADIHNTRFKLDLQADPYSCSFSDSFDLLIGMPLVVIVDDDGGDDYEMYYKQCLDRLSIFYRPVDTKNGNIGEQLLDYQAVVWLTGDEPLTKDDVLDSIDIVDITNYLNNGGNLFITGQNIEACDSSFYHDYLHAELVSDSGGNNIVNGVAGDEITDGMRFWIWGGDGASNQTHPSVILPTLGADSIFFYTVDSTFCGVKYADVYKIVYLAFGFEAIHYQAGADNLMEKILTWFDVLPGVAEEPDQISPSFWLSAAKPNPFIRETMIRYAVTGDHSVSLKIYDLTGRLIKTLVDGQRKTGEYSVKWNAINRPAGIYFVKLSAGDYTQTKKLILMR